MSEKIGRFEIASQLARSAFANVYKASDPESQQTVALKVVHLDRVKDRSALLKRVFEEADQAKSLNSPNIAGLYGVGDEGDLLFAAMEYVQGVSAATTLGRGDGFSIWDFQDIARQVCHALDHAEVHKAVHQSLEPAKIMVQWDGMVKVLGFGTSLMNSQALELSEVVPDVLHYASPEQLRGEKCDHRSALFSLGAILYEMATEQQAFPGETADQVRSAILEGTPPLPHRLKPNVNPALSALIMKAIAKSPEERFQSGQELVREMEQCKAGGSSTAAPVILPTPAKTTAKAAAVAAGAGTASASGSSVPAPKASAAAAAQRSKPKIAVDPMMAEEADSAAAQQSFSEISELPPLKEVYVAPPPPPVEQEPEVPKAAPVFNKAADKPKTEFREVARKAVREIRRTPTRLYLYAVGCAVFVIALYLGGMALYNYMQDHDSSAVTPPPAAQSAASQPATAPQPAPTSNTTQNQAEQPDESQSADQAETVESSAGRNAKHGRVKRPHAPALSAVVPAELSISSTPAGAQIAFDGASLCQTPCTLTGIASGQHTVTATKPGYAGATRTLAMLSGANSSVTLELALQGATLSVSSTPAGAVIVIDGKDSGKLTPSQFTFSKSGTHNITLRRAGYLDQDSSANVEAGQAAAVNLKLTQLGSTDEIHSAGGKFKKVFGRGGDASGMGTVSIKTQPKGAQIMVNNRVLDKTTPFDFYLNPGTYVIDVSLSGYQPLHRVITVQEGEKLAIQETLAAQ